MDELYAYWAAGGGNALVVLPTGSGKSLVLAALCQELLAEYPSLRIAIVTHVRELIAQNYLELMAIWPDAPAGIYSAGMNRRDTRSALLFCGIQSVHNKTQLLGAIDVLLVDEAHLIPRSTETTYGRFIARARAMTPDLRVVGLTATPFRLDTGRLDEGPGRVFDKVVYDAPLADLIKQGYLSPLSSKATAQKLDVRGVGKRGGDYIPSQLEAAVDRADITAAAAAEMAKYGADRKSWLAFCSGVMHAAHMRDAIRDVAGVSCETITGETPKRDRDAIITAFKAGEVRCLTSVGVLGTGFNHPAVDMIALLRPTQSAGLFLQQVGRGLRNAPGKANCLILDFAELTKMHGPVDQILGQPGRAEPEKQTVKECPQCDELVPMGTEICPSCNYVWPKAPPRTPKHRPVADAETSIISTGEPAWVDVDEVRYFRHEKLGGVPSLRVEYRCGIFLTHRQWVCFEHSGYARAKAEEWWLRAAPGPVPNSVDEALFRSRQLLRPSAIRVRPDVRYFAVIGRRFEQVDA